MKNVVKIYPVFIVCILLVFSFTTVFGQDLGSSNGLFRASNPKSKKTSTEKKPTAKSNSAKTTAVKRTVKKTSPRRNSRDTAKKADSTAKKQDQIAKKTVKKNNLRRNDIIITVGKTTTGDVSQL